MLDVGGSFCRCDPRFCKAPVQAVRVPETPDVTVATSMQAPAASALAVQVVGHQDDEACGWTAKVSSREQMAHAGRTGSIQSGAMQCRGIASM